MNYRSLPRLRITGALALAIALTGCASMQSHDKLATDMQSAGQSGGVAASLARLEASATSDDERAALLYNLERGELLRLDKRYEDSNHAFMLADNQVKNWEATAATNPSKLMGTVGAALISERLKDYEGQDYEKSLADDALGAQPRGLGRLGQRPRRHQAHARARSGDCRVPRQRNLGRRRRSQDQRCHLGQQRA